MSDAFEPRSTTPFPAGGGAPPAPLPAADPLAGDWSEGLRGPVRALGIAAPRLLAPDPVQHLAPPPAPPAASEPPSVIITFTDPPPSLPPVAALPDVAPTFAPPAVEETAKVSDVRAWTDAIAAVARPGAGPTPWSEPVPDAPAAPVAEPWRDAPLEVPAKALEQEAAAWSQAASVGAPAQAIAPPSEEPSWEMPAPGAPVADAAGSWTAAPAGEPVQEWAPQAPAGDWQQAQQAELPPVEVPAVADWGTMANGPDWSAAPPQPAAAAPENWDPTPPAEPEPIWQAAPSPGEAPAQEEWSPPEVAAQAAAAPSAPAAETASAPAWNSAPVGASALEQLDSEPPEKEEGAALELFGSVPVGASLAAEEDQPEDLGPPEELASPEEVLKPVEDDDPDLLVPVDEKAAPRPPPRPSQPLGVLQPQNPLFVEGEHRVAVHTRGGRTRRGSVKDVDLGKSHFPLLPQGSDAPEPVYHAEVKAIFFMLAAGEKPDPASGRPVRVTFADGRSIEGQRDGAEAKHGFFLVPSDAARTNTRRIYVARDATTEIKDG